MQGSARIDELRQKFHENPRRYFAPLANEYRKAGDPEQAIAICRAHLAQQPGHMSGHVVYGQALYDAQRIDESRTVFEKALSLDPDNAIVLRQLGDIARQRGETPEAKHWYGRALEADPHDSEVAAYIAELTEPLTGSAEIAAPVTAEAPTEATSEPGAAEVAAEGEAVETHEEVASSEADGAGVTTDADSDEPAPTETADVASDTPASVEVSEEPAPAAAAMESVSGEASSERDARTDTSVATPIVPLADVAWRKTPPHEDSPFVTRTMAELYAKQGYRAAALDVYRNLALANPVDQEILARLEELTREPGSVAEPPHSDEAPSAAEQRSTEAGQSAEASEQPAREADAAESGEGLEPAEGAEPAEVVESAKETETAVEEAVSETADAEPVTALDLGGLERGMEAPADWSDISDNADAVYTPSEQELDVEPEPPSPPDGRHFTELELSAGDTWDTDTWGAGFSSNESTDLELDVPDTPILDLGPPPLDTGESAAAPPSHEPVAQPEADTEPEAVAETTETVSATEPEIAPAEEETAAVADEPVAAPSSFAERDSGESDSAIDSVAPDPQVESEPEAIAETPAAEHEKDEATQFVAYSPQPPDEDDLAHYEPKGPTIREFFATLGARKPPTHESNQSFTARAAVPAHENPSEYPLAASAFADLFPDSPVKDEDTRAAFALSGAMSSAPSGAPGSTPPETVRNTPSAAAPPVENAQESEEDIRRFREWLDGLAES